MKIHYRVCKHNKKRPTYRTLCGIRLLKNSKVPITLFDDHVTCKKCLKAY
jgi:hypothetical protein